MNRGKPKKEEKIDEHVKGVINNFLFRLCFELLLLFLEDCVWGIWSFWSPCSISCGGGTNTRSRNKIRNERNGGNCSGSGRDSKRCNTQSCFESSTIGATAEPQTEGIY